MYLLGVWCTPCTLFLYCTLGPGTPGYAFMSYMSWKFGTAILRVSPCHLQIPFDACGYLDRPSSSPVTKLCHSGRCLVCHGVTQQASWMSVPSLVAATSCAMQVKTVYCLCVD